eukprot:gb/GECG01012874.1/.p1 GENE.gb/GECG01012874.1/~~gb/GECG01012874.1/.p1  ORF type:complete len:572 (+),score=72.94 gb/GECG01012874.1/:1-1716(+)
MMKQSALRSSTGDSSLRGSSGGSIGLESGRWDSLSLGQSDSLDDGFVPATNSNVVGCTPVEEFLRAASSGSLMYDNHGSYGSDKIGKWLRQFSGSSLALDCAYWESSVDAFVEQYRSSSDGLRNISDGSFSFYCSNQDGENEGSAKSGDTLPLEIGDVRSGSSLFDDSVENCIPFSGIPTDIQSATASKVPSGKRPPDDLVCDESGGKHQRLAEESEEPWLEHDLSGHLYQEPVVNGSTTSKPLELRLNLTDSWYQELARCSAYFENVLVEIVKDFREEQPRFFAQNGKGKTAGDMKIPTVREMWLEEKSGAPSQLVIKIQRKPKNPSDTEGWLPTSKGHGGFPFQFRVTLRPANKSFTSFPTMIHTKQSLKQTTRATSTVKFNRPKRNREGHETAERIPSALKVSTTTSQFLPGHGLPQVVFQEYLNESGNCRSEDIVVMLRLSQRAKEAISAYSNVADGLDVRLVKDDADVPVEPEYFDVDTELIKVARPCVTQVSLHNGILTVYIKRKGQGKNNSKSLPLSKCHGGFPFRFCFRIRDVHVHHDYVETVSSQPVEVRSKQPKAQQRRPK